MKIAYILVGVLILVGAYFLLAPETKAPTTDDIDANVEQNADENADASNETNESGDTGSEEADSSDLDASVATDAGMEFPTVGEENGEKVFTIDAFSFGYTPNAIRVNEGDMVTINLTNSGGLHDWVVDEFDAATARIGEGETTEVTFVADKAGTYEFYCSIGNHRERGMVGTLVVE